MPTSEATQQLLRDVLASLGRVEAKLEAHRKTTDENTAALGRRTMRQRIALIGLAVAFLLAGFNYRNDRQTDCARSDDQRSAVRLVVRLAGDSTERAVARFGADGAAVLDALRDENDATERTTARLFPPRDCGGFLP